MSVAHAEYVLADFDATGVAFPIPALGADELRDVRRQYARMVDAGVSTRLDRTHLHFDWSWDLATHPRIVDVVSSILGDDIVVWGTLILSKPAHDDSFIAWHQDGAYAGFLGDAPSVSAWIALSDSTIESGCMRVVPGSQKRRHEHLQTHHPHNMLNRGQEIAVEVDETTAVDIELRAGEMSLHHVDIVHGSNANRASWTRTGFIVRYSTPAMIGAPIPVVVVRGRDVSHLPVLPARPSLSFDDALASLRVP